MAEKSSSSPDLPWRVRMMTAFISFITDASRRSNGSINRRLYNIFNYFLRFSQNQTPVNGVKTIDISIDSTINLWFRLFVPNTTTTTTTTTKKTNDVHDEDKVPLLPVIIYFHGGGFSYLSPDFMFFDIFCRRLARRIPAVVVSVNYRSTPEYPYPAQYEDGFRCLSFLDDKRDFTGLPANADLTQCFLVGDSAGGNLAHHVACRASETEFRELKVIGLIAIQPWFGGVERTESEIRLNNRAPILSIDRCDWHWKAFLPEGCNRDHEAVNVFGPKVSRDIAELKNFPATLVVIGGFDMLQDWQRQYYKGLRRGGKEVYLLEYPTAIHMFYCFFELRDSSMLIKEMKNFIQNQIIISEMIFGSN